MMRFSQNPDLWKKTLAAIGGSGKGNLSDLEFAEHCPKGGQAGNDPRDGFWGCRIDNNGNITKGLNLQGQAVKEAIQKLVLLPEVQQGKSPRPIKAFTNDFLNNFRGAICAETLGVLKNAADNQERGWVNAAYPSLSGTPSVVAQIIQPSPATPVTTLPKDVIANDFRAGNLKLAPSVPGRNVDRKQLMVSPDLAKRFINNTDHHNNHSLKFTLEPWQTPKDAGGFIILDHIQSAQFLEKLYGLKIGNPTPDKDGGSQYTAVNDAIRNPLDPTSFAQKVRNEVKQPTTRNL